MQNPAKNLTRKQTVRLYNDILEQGLQEGQSALNLIYREFSRQDLFFMLGWTLSRFEVGRSDFLFERCREVQNEPNNCIDLWAREHFKSSIITNGLTIQELMIDPELTFGIFSHTRDISKAFLKQIKREFEGNDILRVAFPDIIWNNPRKEAPQWNEDDGIILKRKKNPKEASIEAWGLVEAQPTGRHFSRLVYDDVVTLSSVRTPGQIENTTNAYRLSLNLGAEGGVKRIIGTRYHFNDTYGQIMRDSPDMKVRLHAATKDGTYDGEPVLLSSEKLAEKRREMGPYIFACLDGNTQILMSDWSVKPISSIKEGDMVAGWTMEPGKRSKLVPTKVTATQHHRADTVKINMETGASVVCTPDHKWWSGRRKEVRGRTVYSPASLGYRGLSSLCEVIDITDNRWPSDPNVIEAAAYIAGIFDGEGTVRGDSIHISQCEKTHPEVVKRIRTSLNILNFDYGEHRPKDREHQVDFYLRGGRQELFRFLALCDPAKRMQVADSMFKSKFGNKTRKKITSIEAHQRQTVYNIETETGNYIANGFCSKNCQMLQNPKADSIQGFEQAWFRTYTPFGTLPNHNTYILVDPASARKSTSDYTAMFVIGAGCDNNIYIKYFLRDRLNLVQRTEKLFSLVRQFHPLQVGYERYGMQADVEHIKQRQEQEGFRFSISELGGQMPKFDRILRLVPYFEQGRIWFPEQQPYIRVDGTRTDLVQEFKSDEYEAYPVCAHDDMLDCLARLLDIGIRFPTNKFASAQSRGGFYKTNTDYDVAHYGMEG